MYFHALVLCLRAALHGALSVQTRTESNQPSEALAQIPVVRGSCWPLRQHCCQHCCHWLQPWCRLMEDSRNLTLVAKTRPQPCRSVGRLPERGSARPRQRCCRAWPRRAACGLSFLYPVFPTFSIFLACVCPVCPVLCCAKAFLHWISDHCFSGAEKALFLCSNPPLKSSKNHCTCDVSVDWNEMTYRQVWEVLSDLFSSIYHNTGLPDPA